MASIEVARGSPEPRPHRPIPSRKGDSGASPPYHTIWETVLAAVALDIGEGRQPAYATLAGWRNRAETKVFAVDRKLKKTRQVVDVSHGQNGSASSFDGICGGAAG